MTHKPSTSVKSEISTIHLLKRNSDYLYFLNHFQAVRSMMISTDQINITVKR